MDSQEKTAASRVADVVVWLISLLILFGGFLGWRVYQANPQRNDYDLAVGIFDDAYTEVKDLRVQAEPLLEDCERRTGGDASCQALQSAYDSARFDEPKKLSRITSASTYKKETARVKENIESARAVRDALRTNMETVNVAIEAFLEQTVGAERAQMRESAKVAASEISACQDVIDKTEGTADNYRVKAQEAVDSLQLLVDQADVIKSDNPEDYLALDAQLRQGVEQVTYWINQLNIYISYHG